MVVINDPRRFPVRPEGADSDGSLDGVYLALLHDREFPHRPIIPSAIMFGQTRSVDREYDGPVTTRGEKVRLATSMVLHAMEDDLPILFAERGFVRRLGDLVVELRRAIEADAPATPEPTSDQAAPVSADVIKNAARKELQTAIPPLLAGLTNAADANDAEPKNADIEKLIGLIATGKVDAKLAYRPMESALKDLGVEVDHSTLSRWFKDNPILASLRNAEAGDPPRSAPHDGKNRRYEEREPATGAHPGDDESVEKLDLPPEG